MLATVTASAVNVATAANVATATATTAARVETRLSGLSKAGLRLVYHERFQTSAPTTWTMVKLINAIEAGEPGRSKNTKAELTALASAKLNGAPVPKSWTIAKLSAFVNGNAEPPRTSAVKSHLAATYAAKNNGVTPPKSWTTAAIADAIESGRQPGSHRVPGGLTADACRKLITVAIATGKLEAAVARGRSSWKADQLRAFVAEHNLSA